MEWESNRNYVDPVILQSSKGQVWIDSYSINRDNVRGKFYIPVYQFEELQDRILQENWNVRDIMQDKVYQTFLEVNFDRSAAIIKVMYSNNRYEWISFESYENNEKYQKGWISHIKVNPYFYVDDYGQTLIAGQLRFLELNLDELMPELSISDEDDKLSKILSDDTPQRSWICPESQRVEINRDDSTPALDRQLVNVIRALGLSPKEAIKILVDHI